MKKRVGGSASFVGEFRIRLIATFFCLAFSPVVSAAEEPPLDLPPLPDAATPGGSLPLPQMRAPQTVDPNQLVFEIPPVFQRPLGIEEGGRVFVREFLITGVIDDPDAGIIKSEIDRLVAARFEDLNDLLARLRVSRQNQDAVGPDGFTPEEREEIIDFMSDVVKDLSPDRRLQAYQGFVDQLRLQRLERNQGLTIGQLQLVADEVTRYYRDKGFFLARAVIPAQEVVDGVVVIRVLEGRLGDVRAEGNEDYSLERLQAPFEDVIGELVTVTAIEDSLLTLQSYPGLSAVGVFQPGDEVGTADLLVNVTAEESWDALLRADNHGTQFTGETRVLGDFDWNNPFGYGDLFQLTALQTFEPENSLFGGISYDAPLADPRMHVGLDLSRNNFEVANISTDFAGNEVAGVSTSASLYMTQDFLVSRATKVDARYELVRKSAETRTGDVVTGTDELAVLAGQLNYENINSESATITSAYARLSLGFDGVLGVPDEDELVSNENRTSRQGIDGPVGSRFTKLNFGYSWLKSLTANQTLLLRTNGQYTEDLLTSLDQFVIGGPSTVRALPASQYLVDNAVFVSAEWGIRAPGFGDVPAFSNLKWGDVLRFTVFYDYGYGEYLEEDVVRGGETVRAGGAGLGIEFGVPGTFRLNVQWARLTNGVEAQQDSTDPQAVEDDSQIWMDLTFQF